MVNGNFFLSENFFLNFSKSKKFKLPVIPQNLSSFQKNKKKPN